MGIGIGTAIAISAGTSMISAGQQRSAQEDAIDEQNRLMEEARAEEQRIFAQQAEDAKNQQAETVQFGIDDDDSTVGSYNDFLTPTTTAKSGLTSSKAVSPLGF